MRFMLGVDVGGTFTDFVSYNAESKSIEVWKEPSAPGDPVTGILNGLADFKDRARLDNIRLGTTIATNAVLERKGATVAYITTLGHRDVPFIQRGNRKFHYDMSWVKPKPLVKRRHCFELNERIDAYGAVITPLDDAEVSDIAKRIAAMPEIEADAGIPASTVVIRSNGGEMTLEAAANAPVHMVVSGPTGGVIAGRHVADLVGIDRLVTLDMGGTSTDVSTIVGGK